MQTRAPKIRFVGQYLLLDTIEWLGLWSTSSHKLMHLLSVLEAIVDEENSGNLIPITCRKTSEY